MVHADRDPASNRREKARMRRSVVVLAAATLVGLIAVLAIGAPTTHATFPARNGQLAFFGDRGSGADIYTMNADGTGLRRLTHLEGDEEGPDWSPDGARIVFWLDPHPPPAVQNMYSGYVMNADGSDLHQVTPKRTSAEFPAFTPDGDHLVYDCEFVLDDQDRPGPCPGGSDPIDHDVYLMRDDGSDALGLPLSTNPFPRQGDRNPEVSPDGQTATFVRTKLGGRLQALFAVDIDGGDVRQLTSYRREVANKHDWAPDGNQIVITTKADYPPEHHSPNVATIRPDGSHLRMLTDYSGGEKGAYAGSYSPNGRWIAFRVENVEKKRFRLYRMHPDGTHRELIKRLPFAPRAVDWGPRP
jgi:Tol biopolymer transport system component